MPRQHRQLHHRTSLQPRVHAGATRLPPRQTNKQTGRHRFKRNSHRSSVIVGADGEIIADPSRRRRQGRARPPLCRSPQVARPYRNRTRENEAAASAPGCFFLASVVSAPRCSLLACSRRPAVTGVIGALAACPYPHRCGYPSPRHHIIILPACLMTHKTKPEQSLVDRSMCDVQPPREQTGRGDRRA